MNDTMMDMTKLLEKATDEELLRLRRAGSERFDVLLTIAARSGPDAVRVVEAKRASVEAQAANPSGPMASLSDAAYLDAVRSALGTSAEPVKAGPTNRLALQSSETEQLAAGFKWSRANTVWVITFGCAGEEPDIF
jgi:hypothetical protein